MELQSTMKVANFTYNAGHKTYSLIDILTRRGIYDHYLNTLNVYIKFVRPGASLKNIIAYVGIICPDLIPFHDLSNYGGKSLNKGVFGQVIEQALFGGNPNSRSEADLHALGIELKILPIKALKQTKQYPYERVNTKERTKLSAAGCEKNPVSFKGIIDASRFEDTKCYKKSKHISYIGFDSPNKKWKTLDELLKNEILFFATASLDTLPDELKEEIAMDFVKIQTSIREKKYTQRGQKSLHCHRCGSKGADGNRALGFTPKFTLKIIAHVLGIAIECKGSRSWIRGDSL